MCGRYVQSKRARDHARLLAMREGRAEEPRTPTWNLAPTTMSLAVRNDEQGLQTDWLNWGFGRAQLRPINARVETAQSKPMFREAWNERRCAVPADGWYEWRLEHGRKQPYYFARGDDEPLYFAGLWSAETFCILTMAADGDLREIHDRRPLALEMNEAKSWIATLPPSVEGLIRVSIPAEAIGFHPVDLRVNSPRNDGPELIVKTVRTPPHPQQTGDLDLFPNSM